VKKLTHVTSAGDLARKIETVSSEVKTFSVNLSFLIRSTAYRQKDLCNVYMMQYLEIKTIFENIGILTLAMFDPKLTINEPDDFTVDCARTLRDLRVKSENMFNTLESMLKSTALMEVTSKRELIEDANTILTSISKEIVCEGFSSYWTYAFKPNQVIKDNTTEIGLYYVVELKNAVMYETQQKTPDYTTEETLNSHWNEYTRHKKQPLVITKTDPDFVTYKSDNCLWYEFEFAGNAPKTTQVVNLESTKITKYSKNMQRKYNIYVSAGPKFVYNIGAAPNKQQINHSFYSDYPAYLRAVGFPSFNRNADYRELSNPYHVNQSVGIRQL
jgi:hypothetical protein